MNTYRFSDGWDFIYRDFETDQEALNFCRNNNFKCCEAKFTNGYHIEWVDVEKLIADPDYTPFYEK